MDITKELKKDGMLLKRFLKGTNDRYLQMAIRQNPLALQFVSRKCLDSKMCLAAVKRMDRHFGMFLVNLLRGKCANWQVEADPELLNMYQRILGH